MATKTQWTPTDESKALTLESLGLCSNVLEFQDNKGEWHHFYIVVTLERIAFGGFCNAGFLESGYIAREEFESLYETLQEMLSDLETYYNDGKDYTSRIVHNERM